MTDEPNEPSYTQQLLATILKNTEAAIQNSVAVNLGAMEPQEYKYYQIYTPKMIPITINFDYTLFDKNLPKLKCKIVDERYTVEPNTYIGESWNTYYDWCVQNFGEENAGRWYQETMTKPARFTFVDEADRNWFVIRWS